jgi:DNA polymerase (family 10)
MEKQRIPREAAMPFFGLVDHQMPSDVRWMFGGSWRRETDTVGDMDVLVITETGTFDGFRFPPCFESAKGNAKIRHGLVRSLLGQSLPAQFWACTPEQEGAFAMFITGPAAFNIMQRAKAKRKGYKLSQYGLFKDGVLLPLYSEYEVYAELGWVWLEPEERR